MNYALILKEATDTRTYGDILTQIKEEMKTKDINDAAVTDALNIKIIGITVEDDAVLPAVGALTHLLGTTAQKYLVPTGFVLLRPGSFAITDDSTFLPESSWAELTTRLQNAKVDMTKPEEAANFLAALILVLNNTFLQARQEGDKMHSEAAGYLVSHREEINQWLSAKTLTLDIGGKPVRQVLEAGLRIDDPTNPVVRWDEASPKELDSIVKTISEVIPVK